MERGREGRRGGGGGGLVHAPRRPRTGFKDAAVGDDAEDMMDDVHNSRLRERAKKDAGGLSFGHGVATSIVGPSSRNKRKRQGSQEIQVHSRNSPADEVEETTEDAEMGVSEDDDDPPPPIIPRRPGKPRPQGKFAEDGIAVDLPAVPRKARTAIGKRPQESTAPSVPDSPAHGVVAVAASTPAPSSTPSSSSIASLKPGRRTKPSGSKPRGHKLAKVSTPSLVSEQEVEVAEALFDLARMCTQPPPSSAAVEAKKDSRASVNEVKPESKQEVKVGGSSLPPNGHASVLSAGIASVAGGSVRSNSPGVGSAASPAPSPPAATAASVADASKKKRPKVRTRTEEGVVVQSRMAPSPASAAGSVVAPVKDADLLTSRSSTAERSGVKVEGSGPVSAGAVAVASNVSVPTLSAPGAGVASSGMDGLPSSVPVVPVGVSVGVSVGRVEKKGVQSEKKIGSVGGKAEGSVPISVEKRVSGSPVREKKSASGEAAAAPAAVDAPAAASLSAGIGAVSTKMEVDKRSPEASAGPSDVDHVPKRDIDLMVAPSKAVGLSSAEKDGYSGDGEVGDASEKRLVDSSAVSVSEDRLRAERDREREEKERSELERVHREKERERELERERVDRDRRREAESARELVKEAAKEREREKERERLESSKAGMAVQRSGKSGKAENGRTPKASERAGSGPASGASTMLGSVASGAGSGGTGVGGNVAVLPMSVGMLSWPAGMAGGLGYFPAAAAAAAAVSAATVEDSSPAAQVAPYVMGGRSTWKRCATHVYIARFIDMQQQVNWHHQSFFAGGNQVYPRSYNLNVPLAPSESLFGGAGGGGAVGGAAASGSTGGSVSVSGTGSANLEAAERGLNAAVMAAAAAASMQGAKERASYSMDMVSRKSPGQHQGSAPGAPALSLQSGAMFGFPNAGSGSPSDGVGGGGSIVGGGAMGGTNLNLPPGPGPGPGPGVALSSGGGSSPALVLGPVGPVGGLSSGGSSGAAASPSAALQQAQQAMMHQAMLHQAQSGSFPFAQFPPHFGPAPFSGPAPHMGAQQAAAQFYAGGPYFAHHLVSPSQLQGGQPSVSAGGVPVSKVQQQSGGSRSFGGGVSVPPQSPSHSSLQGGSHAVGRSGEREGSAVGDNGSSGEGKLPMSRVSTLGSGGSVGMSLHSGGAGAADYNLMSGLGKPSKSREQVPGGVSQGGSTVQLQGQGPHQHHYHGGLVGGKGAPSQGFSVNMNMAAAMSSRGASVGPGPLGLAPVAAVMAPQGHAMIQSVAESGRVHPQGAGSGHGHAQLGGGGGHSSMMQQGRQHLMHLQHAQQQHFQAQAQQQQQQQQQHLQQQSVPGQQLQQQRGAPNARSSAGPTVEDSRGVSDGSYASGVGRVREREVVEERKLQGKRVSSSAGGASPLSRDLDGGGGMQSSAGGGRSVGTTLNLMAPITGGMGVRSSGPSGGALSVGAPMQAQAQASAMSGSKASVGRPKSSGVPGAGAGPTGGSVSGAAHVVGTQASFSERLPAVSGGAVGVGGKSSPPGGLSLGGPTLVTGPVGRPGSGGQHPGAKASPGPSGRATLVSGSTASPTAPGTNLQAVLAAAMAKNSQGPLTQRSSGNATAAASSNASANLGSSLRPGAGTAGPPASSGAAPLASTAPATKSSGPNPSKGSSSVKSAFPSSGKGGGGAVAVGGGGKRASSPSSGGHVPSILGPSPLAQNMPSKSSQPPQVQMQGPGQWEGLQQGQLAPPQLLQQQQFHHQHQQMMRQQQQMLQQHHQQHQMQQSPHMQGSASGPPHLQAPKQASHQQQGGVHQQLAPPAPSSAAQSQQVSINQQNQQQAAHTHLQQQASQAQQQFGGLSGNGSLSFSSGLSMGAGNSSSGGVGVRTSYPESVGVALNVRPLQSVKPSGSGSNPALNGVGPRVGPGPGPVFLQQFGSSVAAPSGQQQSGSPRGGNASGYSQAQGNASSVAGGRSGDGKSFPDGGQEQVNGVRMAPGSAQARGVAPMAASPGAPGSSQRGPSGGSGPGPGPSSVGSTKAVGVGQYNGFGDVGQLRTSMMSNSGSGSGSGVGMSGSGSNVQSVGNGRPAFSGGSLHGGGSGQGPIQAASSLAMTGPAVVPSGGPAAALGPQPTTSVVQN